jgi:RNA polymerase sigma factor (sigma-70 family)
MEKNSMKDIRRLSEGDLVDAAKAPGPRTEEAKAELVRRAEKMFTAICNSKGIEPWEFDDARQAARLGFLRALRLFESDRGTPLQFYARPFVIGEIHRYVIDQRKQDRHAEWPESEEEMPGLIRRLAVEEKGLVLIHERLTARELLAALPPAERRILLRVVVADKSQAAVAYELGVSAMSVSRTMKRISERARRDAA